VAVVVVLHELLFVVAFNQPNAPVLDRFNNRTEPIPLLFGDVLHLFFDVGGTTAEQPISQPLEIEPLEVFRGDTVAVVPTPDPVGIGLVLDVLYELSEMLLGAVVCPDMHITNDVQIERVRP
jgi:hypothetical protein